MRRLDYVWHVLATTKALVINDETANFVIHFLLKLSYPPKILFPRIAAVNLLLALWKHVGIISASQLKMSTGCLVFSIALSRH